MQRSQTLRAGCCFAISLVEEVNSTLDLKITQSLPEIKNIYTFNGTSHQHHYHHHHMIISPDRSSLCYDAAL